MFSPYYAWARRRSADGRADPLDHCAINVALYGRGGRWTMTERGRTLVQRESGRLRIGPSALHWDGSGLHIELDEITAPWPSRVRGTVTVQPTARVRHAVRLADQGNHRWHPIAPVARVTVDLQSPALRWQGNGYFDANLGDAPLEQAFERWDWSRAHLADGRSVVLYDAERIGAAPLRLGLAFGADGSVAPLDVPRCVALPPTGWRVDRHTRCDAHALPGRPTTWTDAPFYARSTLPTQLLGEAVTAVHESLSLRRFRHPLVQAMLPFRMPRVAR